MFTLLKTWLHASSLAQQQVSRRPRSFRPRLEGLEDRALPSAGLHPAPAPSAHVSHALMANVQTAVTHPLSGAGKGTYKLGNLATEVGIRFNLQGEADLAAMGHVTVTGSIHAPGFVAQSHAAGQLTFSNGRGSVTIKLTGKADPGATGLPQKYDYQVIAHTGAFANLADQGTLTLVLTALPTSGQQSPHGTFMLSM
jgi:hypothetical protein